jgi:hypothetical protein
VEHVRQEHGYRPSGKIIRQATTAEEQILTVEIDRSHVVEARRRFPLFRDRRPDSYTAITSLTELSRCTHETPWRAQMLRSWHLASAHSSR